MYEIVALSGSSVVNARGEFVCHESIGEVSRHRTIQGAIRALERVRRANPRDKFELRAPDDRVIDVLPCSSRPAVRGFRALGGGLIAKETPIMNNPETVIRTLKRMIENLDDVWKNVDADTAWKIRECLESIEEIRTAKELTGDLLKIAILYVERKHIYHKGGIRLLQESAETGRGETAEEKLNSCARFYNPEYVGEARMALDIVTEKFKKHPLENNELFAEGLLLEATKYATCGQYYIKTDKGTIYMDTIVYYRQDSAAGDLEFLPIRAGVLKSGMVFYVKLGDKFEKRNVL